MTENGRKTKKRNLALLKLFPAAFLLFVFAFFFLLYPKKTAANVSEGIELCLGVVVPSLFPFMVLSSAFSSSVLCEKLGAFFKKPVSFVFALSPACFCPVLISLFGGYPTAAFCARQLFERGEISKRDFRRLLLFAVNPSPSFAVGAVGSMLLSSKKAGAVIFASIIVSSFILGIFSRLVKTGENENNESFAPLSPSLSFSKILVDSIMKSGRSMLFICFSVLFFSAALAVTDTVFPSREGAMFFGALFEVTCAAKRCCGVLPTEIIAGIVAWGGLCTHFQVMNEVSLSGLKTSVFLSFRLLHGALSVVVCSFLLKIFPEAAPAFSQRAESFSFSCASSVPLSLCLVAMCVLLLLGNNFVLSKKQKSC